MFEVKSEDNATEYIIWLVIMVSLIYVPLLTPLKKAEQKDKALY